MTWSVVSVWERLWCVSGGWLGVVNISTISVADGHYRTFVVSLSNYTGWHLLLPLSHGTDYFCFSLQSFEFLSLLLCHFANVSRLQCKNFIRNWHLISFLISVFWFHFFNLISFFTHSFELKMGHDECEILSLHLLKAG